MRSRVVKDSKIVLPWDHAINLPDVVQYGQAAISGQYGCVLSKKVKSDLATLIGGDITPVAVVEYMKRDGRRQTNRNELSAFRDGLFLNPHGNSEFCYASRKGSWFVAPSSEDLHGLGIKNEKISKINSGRTVYLELGTDEPSKIPKLKFETVLSLSDLELQMLGSNFSGIFGAHDMQAVIGISDRGQQMAEGFRQMIDVHNLEIFERRTSNKSLRFRTSPWSNQEKPKPMSLAFLEGMKVALVDDGIHTGKTLREAIEKINQNTDRKKQPEIHVFIGVRQRDFVKHMESRARFEKSSIRTLADSFGVKSIHFLDEMFLPHS